jgi:hypothetical protein
LDKTPWEGSEDTEKKAYVEAVWGSERLGKTIDFPWKARK